MSQQELVCESISIILENVKRKPLGRGLLEEQKDHQFGIVLYVTANERNCESITSNRLTPTISSFSTHAVKRGNFDL